MNSFNSHNKTTVIHFLRIRKQRHRYRLNSFIPAQFYSYIIKQGSVAPNSGIITTHYIAS